MFGWLVVTITSIFARSRETTSCGEASRAWNWTPQTPKPKTVIFIYTDRTGPTLLDTVLLQAVPSSVHR